MDRLFLILLRILFPLDPVARLRELMRVWLRTVMGWLEDPEEREAYAYWAEDRARLESCICFLEYAMQVLLHDRARQTLGLRFIFIPLQEKPHIRNPASMSQLFQRLTQLARNFHNLDELATRRAERMKRERDTNSLGLSVNHPYTVHRAIASALEVLPRQRRGRWRAHACARDGGGCASSRGSAHARGPPLTSLDCVLLPADCLALTCGNAPPRPPRF